MEEEKSLNRFLVKITAVVLVGLLVILGLICLIGFKIGGAIGWLHAAIFFGLSILIGFGAVLIIYNDNEHRNKLSSKALIAGMAICMALFCYGYGWINSLSAGSEVKEYTATVDYVSNARHDIITEYVEFDNPAGERCRKKTYAFPGDGYEFGEEILVKEKMGGFGYPVYSIRKK